MSAMKKIVFALAAGAVSANKITGQRPVTHRQYYDDSMAGYKVTHAAALGLDDGAKLANQVEAFCNPDPDAFRSNLTISERQHYLFLQNTIDEKMYFDRPLNMSKRFQTVFSHLAGPDAKFRAAFVAFVTGYRSQYTMDATSLVDAAIANSGDSFRRALLAQFRNDVAAEQRFLKEFFTFASLIGLKQPVQYVIGDIEEEITEIGGLPPVQKFSPYHNSKYGEVM